MAREYAPARIQNTTMIMIWESVQECPGEKSPRLSGQSGEDGHNARQHVAKVCVKSLRSRPTKLEIKILSVHEFFTEGLFNIVI